MREPLDEGVAALLDDLDAVPAWHRLSVPAARRLEDELFAPEDPPAVDVVRDLGFDGPAGDVPVRVYRDVEGPAPVVVFYHGGGFTLGTLDSADDICRLLARRTGCVVASVDYRLAPEHPFPAAVDDAHAALAWAADAAPELGGDPDRLHVAGSSAGGGLAAAVALRTREFGGPALDGQHLLYPMLSPVAEADAGNGGDADREDGPLLSRADLAWFWEQYLRSPVDARNPFAAPALADDLGGLPPATVVTAGHDPLGHEGGAHAERLADAGVDVDHLHYPSLSHGFLSLAGAVDRADAAADEVAAAVRSRW